MGFLDSDSSPDTSFLLKDVGDRGSKLSGGQRQRVQILRSLIMPKEFYIFDEATSAVDHKSESKILEYIAGTTDATILFISHSNNIEKYFDKTISL